MRKLTLTAGLAAGAALLGVLAGCAAWRVDTARKLAASTQPYAVAPGTATTSMLVVGDSTGVGTGSTCPDKSLAGRIAASFPSLAIENRAENGARAADVAAQLRLATRPRYDVILVQVGGNDVIRLTGADELAAAFDDIAREAAARSSLVILMPAGNVGNAPFFFPPVTWVMTHRSRTLHAIVRDTATRHGATYVNLFKERSDDPFVKEPERLHAADGLHPSDDGYAIWESELLAQSGLAAFLR